jgi:hypothetical protein
MQGAGVTEGGPWGPDQGRQRVRLLEWLAVPAVVAGAVVGLVER